MDNVTNIGGQSNFAAQKAGPDKINDTLTEGNNGSALHAEAYAYCNNNQNPNSVWNNPSYAYDGDTTQGATNTTSVASHWTGYLILNLTGTVVGTTISYMVGRSSNSSSLFTTMTINVANQTGSWLNVYNSTPSYASTTWTNATFSSVSYTAIEIQFYRSTGTSSRTVTIYEVRAVNATYTDPANYVLSIEEQFVSVDNSTTNQQLCIFAGNWTAAEALEVDGWNTTSSAWVVLNSSLVTNVWNNITLPSGLLTSNFTIRFRDGNQAGDTVQDSWSIDAMLLHLWNDQYTAQVEFTDYADLQTWTQLVWLADSSWNTSSVNVTIQLYNYTFGGYPSSGNGYVSYNSSSTVNTDQCINQTITSRATDFRNSTGYWKVNVTGVASTQFQMNINWIELQDSYAYVNDSIPYKAWVWYTIQATAASGNPLPYTYVSLYANGTNVAFQNATGGAFVSDPAWIQLDANGTFQLQIESITSSGETFVLYVTVGNIVQQKTITQVPQQ